MAPQRSCSRSRSCAPQTIGDRTALAPPRPSVPAARSTIASQSSFALPYGLTGSWGADSSATRSVPGCP